MYVSHLSLTDFRSYGCADVPISPGVSAFVGPNGQGKTNLVEAIDYIASQSSHRVASDLPLVRFGASHAVIRTTVQRDQRQALIEIEINPGKSNRARLNRGLLPRAREALGVLRVVIFSPEDLGLVKGDPSTRRRFLDDLLVARQPRFAGVRGDYERVLKQRNTLLRTAAGRGSANRADSPAVTLDVWDTHLARTGAELLSARLTLADALRPHVARHYAEIARATPRSDCGNEATMDYQASLELDPELRDRPALTEALLAEMGRRRRDELDRGVTLTGPHRDDLVLSLGALPARGFASQGESWSLALALRLAAMELLRAEGGDDPVLVLDDVFAELDDLRRRRLAAVVAGTEQVLVTAAVAADVPVNLVDQSFDVRGGQVTRV